MEIWVNPACSKCRAATSYLDEAGIDYTVRRYLDAPPTADELTAVLDRLGLEPWDVTRTGEAVAKEIGLSDLPRDAEHRDRWVAAMVEHPVLIQRPIITADDGTTVVGRDPDSLGRVVDAEAGSRPPTSPR
ncbi:MAG TPA: arsenate reductase family protein [Nocardioidaceae bacterium]